jgi:hypothetical protein
MNGWRERLTGTGSMTGDRLQEARVDRDRAQHQEASAPVDVVLSRWRSRLRQTPDAPPRSGDRGESERLLVATLLRTTESGESTDELSALAAAAAQYGVGQRRERIDPGGLCEELGSLRGVVWEFLKEANRADYERSLKRILAFDRALSIVIRAALRAGYDADDAKRSIQCQVLEK